MAVLFIWRCIYMNKNDLFIALCIPFDESVTIEKIEVVDDVKYVYISREPLPTYCDECGERMHSKGIYTRKINHPILQDSTKVILIVSQRKWKCTNCDTYKNEEFAFLQKFSHSSTLTVFMVLDAMKDLNRSTASIARQFNLSDTQVHNMFTAYVDLPRLPLPEYLSIDEVHMDINEKDKYAFVLMDFVTGEIIDIVHNRRQDTIQSYLLTIDMEERKNVKVIISDAYRTYMDFVTDFFPEAISVLDSFHVTKVLISNLNNYINSVMKKYKEKDKKALEEKNNQTNRENKSIKESNEVVLLRNYRWVLLQNQDEINYTSKRYYHKLLHMYVDTHQIEQMFFELDDNFRYFRDMKEKYISFNHTKYSSEEKAEEALDILIKEYKASYHSIFRNFAKFLYTYKKQIIRSFTTVAVSRKTVDEEKEYYARLSNGPMESFNRKPKDYKRNSRGSSNFDYTRNRILWATRNNPSIRAVPKSHEQIHSYRLKTKKRKATYNKKKK